MFRKIANTIILPSEISSFENSYLQRVNRITTVFFWLHVPAFTVIAAFNDTDPMLALMLTTAVAVGPWGAYRLLTNPRTVTLVYGFAAMLMGGLLVHFGQGPVQIEMHFYFFALLAMLALYGNPLSILVAAITVALHHLLLWIFLPSSVFNYDAPWWVVGVHAAFVVLESVATVYIARGFFDNVIGLEKIVRQRTRELDERNRAMRLVLDNVDEGLVSIDAQGAVQPEYSAAFSRWFGTPPTGTEITTFFASIDEGFAETFELAWDQMREGLLPIDLCVSQAPSTLRHDGKTFEVTYQPLLSSGETVDGLLLVIGDVTAELERRRLETEQRETLNVLDRIVGDRVGFMEFYHEAVDLLASIADPPPNGSETVKRALHTLKGNCMIFGVQTIADLCHRIESYVVREERPPEPHHIDELREAWRRLEQRLHALVSDRDHGRIEIEPAQFNELLRAAVVKEEHRRIAQMVADLRLEPTAARLRRVAAQAERIARRMNKSGVEIQIDDSQLRLEPVRWSSFWSAFIHVIRNAIDHGLEPAALREANGKGANGSLELRTHVEDSHFVISLRDDGRGIDWERVRERAAELGLPHATRQELVDALFSEGLSTAAEVTEHSGRGVGLAAVREACVARNGSVTVDSKPNEGTTFTFRFPSDEMAPDPGALLEAVEQDVRRVA